MRRDEQVHGAGRVSFTLMASPDLAVFDGGVSIKGGDFQRVNKALQRLPILC